MKTSSFGSLLVVLLLGSVDVGCGFSYSPGVGNTNTGGGKVGSNAPPAGVSGSSGTVSTRVSTGEPKVPFSQKQSVSKDGKNAFMVPEYYETFPLGYRPANTRRSPNVEFTGSGSTFNSRDRPFSSYTSSSASNSYAQSPFDSGNRGYGFGENSFSSPDVTYGYQGYPYPYRGQPSREYLGGTAGAAYGYYGYPNYNYNYGNNYNSNYGYNPWYSHQNQYAPYDSARYARHRPHYYQNINSYNGANAKYYVNRNNGQVHSNPTYSSNSYYYNRNNNSNNYLYRQNLNGQTAYTLDRSRNNGLMYY
ncbi:expressed unknown protein [Seminavis robusta]|uniref:Uncharacterized protein n=1 Tax=Seminavis robusta TaxID=568900 RepID=A0A9N8DAP7_9STRA|nr:expressed unknown protein [Seminavis robusta]|eukprot:Sro60_g034550.1 n/a (305) ;mRNA; r:25102-26016